MKATLIDENWAGHVLKKNRDVRNDTKNTLIYYVCYFYEVKNDYSKFKFDPHNYSVTIRTITYAKYLLHPHNF